MADLPVPVNPELPQYENAPLGPLAIEAVLTKSARLALVGLGTGDSTKASLVETGIELAAGAVVTFLTSETGPLAFAAGFITVEGVSWAFTLLNSLYDTIRHRAHAHGGILENSTIRNANISQEAFERMGREWLEYAAAHNIHPEKRHRHDRLQDSTRREIVDRYRAHHLQNALYWVARTVFNGAVPFINITERTAESFSHAISGRVDYLVEPSRDRQPVYLAAGVARYLFENFKVDDITLAAVPGGHQEADAYVEAIATIRAVHEHRKKTGMVVESLPPQ